MWRGGRVLQLTGTYQSIDLKVWRGGRGYKLQACTKELGQVYAKELSFITQEEMDNID